MIITPQEAQLRLLDRYGIDTTLYTGDVLAASEDLRERGPFVEGVDPEDPGTLPDALLDWISLRANEYRQTITGPPPATKIRTDDVSLDLEVRDGERALNSLLSPYLRRTGRVALEPYIDTARHYSEQFMPDVVVIQKPGTQEPDGRGGFTTTPGETITTKGRLAGLTADEEVQASKLSSTSTAKVSVPFAMSVTSADGLTVAGVEYNVQGVLPRSAARSANKNVLVAESG